MRVKTRNTFITIVSDESPPKLRRASTDPGIVGDTTFDPGDDRGKRFDSGLSTDVSPKLACQDQEHLPVNPFKVFVGSLPAQCDEECLIHFMTYFGEVQRVTLKRNQHTGQSRRYGYVKFRTPPSEEIFSGEWSILEKSIRIKRYRVNPCWKRSYQSDPEQTDEGDGAQD
jgi:hypothetical protein